jgi:4a-hydroxytetrahydrobiopterin dehydratase
VAAVRKRGEVDSWLDEHSGWSLSDDATTIRRTVECSAFASAIQLVDVVAEAAESADHHPDIDIRWRTLTFALSTHSEGGLTSKDLALAERIDALAAGH